ncbi:MAG: hypothetical protein OXC00_01995 [Acidimicrobiaceae bacterium]|nr:hypothetical protein [Acidimicrobiaceae bacterium]
MEALHLIAGLAWDPEIRGFMAVFAGVVVLMGSVWLLLALNTGTRLGTLIAVTGFFGWMVIMALVWWIYGIGWGGRTPTWQLTEINVGDLDAAALEQAKTLPDADELPSAFDLVLDSDDPVAQAEFGLVTRDTLTPDQTEGLSTEEIDEMVTDELARNKAATLSELAAVSPGVIADAESSGRLNFGDWTLLSTAEAGEAQASAVAMLLESPDLTFTAQDDFKLLDAYTLGGKRGLPDDPNRLDRIWTQIRTALTITHPTRYGLVQVQEVVDQPLLPGQPPPRPVIDESKPVISVVMVRDLGNLRLKPALVTLGSLCIFAALCLFLHERDKLAWQQREARARADA